MKDYNARMLLPDGSIIYGTLKELVFIRKVLTYQEYFISIPIPK